MEPENNIAIIVVAYNRPKALERILFSLGKSDFDGFLKIPLVISIDKSDNDEVIKVANSFKWKFGEKQIILQKERMGLKKHIMMCGDLTEKYNNIIILEDDLFVSPYFYSYAQCALNFFCDDKRVAGISLYSYDYNELVRQPFVALDDGYDNYFMQIPCSLGQLWTKEQWFGFKQFYESEESALKSTDKLSDVIIHNWPDSSWKKYFYKYMVEKDKYFVYPRISYTTNFGDAGTHFIEQSSSYQVNLNIGKRKMNFSKFELSLSKYDSYFEILPEIIKKFNSDMRPYDFECDLYGIKELNKISKEYLLSAKDCSVPIYSFSATMIPHEMNICEGIKDGFFILAETIHFENKKKP
ncbi:MAG TPA: glycosyltransferase family 2 protein, partial [Bacteroidia bacterium]|nr:glycosyltransferase family 2 protein [Bacteroidia bacterium]